MSYLFKISIFTVVLAIGILQACQSQSQRQLNFPTADLTESNLIPLPLEIKGASSSFPLDQYTRIEHDTKLPGLEQVSTFLSNKIRQRTKLDVSQTTTARPFKSYIYLTKSDDSTMHEEGYELSISSDTILLSARTVTGAFRGAQTIRQLIPNQANDTLADYPIWCIPQGTISDAPQYSHRGTMLDVSRHFFDLSDIKHYIDILAYYKINTLHLHLTDDQGWRIEIKSCPKLTEIGGSTEVGGGKGGFFTQAAYKEIVDYAAEHHILIIPEIDMPGHTNAASVSYPFLNGNGKELKLYTGIKVGFSTFDTRKDSVYQFIDDVIREIAAMTPGPYIHIGGDESHVTKKDDYRYFINRVESIVQKQGKQMIGWDEVANCDVDSTTVAQYWYGKKNFKAALEKNMRVILSPAHKAYLDMKYDSTSIHGLHWAGYIPVDSAYNWSPESFGKRNIMGIEAPLWSETIATRSEMEYLAFPRIIGYAELGWTTANNRNWADYRQRLAQQAAYLKRHNINYYRAPEIPWKE